MAKEVEIIYGTASPLPDPETSVPKAYALLKSAGIKRFDTAQLYTGSEENLGALGAGPEHGFAIDTKWLVGFTADPVAVTPAGLLASARDSVSKLRVDKVNVFYLHGPPADTVPLEQVLEGVDAAHKAGLFEKFGVSNFPPELVRRTYDVAKAKGYVLPTVYQGNYSAVARKNEEQLMPLLRELGISFVAYSPSAGGFLARTREAILAKEGRFSPDRIMGLYYNMYVQDSFLDALDAWGRIAEDEGVSRIELAYRWVRFHSALDGSKGDALIIGASSLEQLRDTLGYLGNGPLSSKSVEGIEAIWKSVEKDALRDNHEALSKKLAA